MIHSLPVKRLMMRECPYSTKTQEVLGNPSPPPSRFPNTSLVLVEQGYIAMPAKWPSRKGLRMLPPSRKVQNYCESESQSQNKPNPTYEKFRHCLPQCHNSGGMLKLPAEKGGNFRRSILLALHALVSQWERRKGKMDMFYTFFTFYTFTHFTRVGHKEIRQSDCTRWRRRGRVMRAPCDNHFFAVWFRQI